MYKISVPLMSRTFSRSDREKIADMLKSMGAQRVFLALGKYETDPKKRESVFKMLKDNTEFLKKHGFEVGAWRWTFAHKDENYIHMVSPSGKTSEEAVCPSDEGFIKLAGDYIKEIAKCGVDLIMYDDDFRYGFIDCGMGCVCKNHLGYMSEILGEEVTKEGIFDKLFLKGPNKYRSAWLKSKRHYLLNFAKEMRKSLDEVNPHIRLGVCSCMSVWDIDGVTSLEIARTLAGKTKPFMRFIGAPYWAVNRVLGNSRLQDVIEIERMVSSWCDDTETEYFCEGDVFPRPRHNCPASYLEGFDIAMRASEISDGILKYVMDYTSGADYETGYVKKHLLNMELYSLVDKHFADKTNVGVRVYEAMQKFENMNLPDFISTDTEVLRTFYSPAAKMLSACQTPTVYKGEGVCGIAFGENVKYIPEAAFEKGLIIDAEGAKILSEKGIDTGIKAWGNEVFVEEEYFVQKDEYVSVLGAKAYSLELKEEAQIQSYFIHDEKKIPASYAYENENGQRFLVFTFNGYFSEECLYRQYTRASQLHSVIPWLSKKESLPAYTENNPDVYVMCKEKNGSLAVGIWNFFADSIEEPVITLAKEYQSIEFINCNGKITGNTVTLSRMEPFSFAAFEVK